MADDRPAEDPVIALANLRKEFDDYRTTMAARLLRRPTGTLESTLLASAKINTLLLQGQTISRTTYADLWEWITTNGLSPSVFGAGDGSTTFVLPDLRGKALVGATSVDPLGKSFGSSSVVLGENHIPAHNHDELTGWGGDHDHGGSTGGNGDHPGHAVGASNAQVGSGRTIPGNSQTDGHHEHGIGNSGNHKHGIPTWGSSNPDPIFLIQPSYAVNWLIWT